MARQRRSEQTRRLILQAASDCFAALGYDATSVDEICSRAGLSKGACYHHFESKHAVFMALLDEWLTGLDAALSQAREGADTVPRALLRMVELTPMVFQTAHGRLPIFLEFWTKAAREPEVWAATVAPYRRYRGLFADLVRSGIAEGTLPAIDAEVAAAVILSLAVGLVLQGILDPEGADWPRVAGEGLRTILAGLSCRPDREQPHGGRA